jgi:hypothetical protein
MLDVKEIKKVFDNFEVEGFSFSTPNSGGHCYFRNHLKSRAVKVYTSSYEGGYIDKLDNTTDYYLFIQRVIEGMNSDDWKIKQCDNIFDVFRLLDGDIISITTVGGYTTDEAKESTIKYVLDKIK